MHAHRVQTQHPGAYRRSARPFFLGRQMEKRRSEKEDEKKKKKRKEGANDEKRSGR